MSFIVLLSLYFAVDRLACMQLYEAWVFLLYNSRERTVKGARLCPQWLHGAPQNQLAWSAIPATPTSVCMVQGFYF